MTESIFTLAVCGSRTLTNPERTHDRLHEAIYRVDEIPGLLADGEDFVVLHGGAPGVDRDAADYFQDVIGVPPDRIEAIHPDWTLGKAAGFIRNQHIVDRADALIAIWDGRSKGTAHTIGLAAKKGIPVIIEVVATG